MLLALAEFTLQQRPEDDFITLLLVHGVMTDIPWPPSQSKLWELPYAMVQSFFSTKLLKFTYRCVKRIMHNLFFSFTNTLCVTLKS